MCPIAVEYQPQKPFAGSLGGLPETREICSLRNVSQVRSRRLTHAVGATPRAAKSLHDPSPSSDLYEDPRRAPIFASPVSSISLYAELECSVSSGNYEIASIRICASASARWPAARVLPSQWDWH
jgi:hypothetical protein